MLPYIHEYIHRLTLNIKGSTNIKQKQRQSTMYSLKSSCQAPTVCDRFFFKFVAGRQVQLVYAICEYAYEYMPCCLSLVTITTLEERNCPPLLS